MTTALLNIATKAIPASICIGLDVEILDISQTEYDYSSDKMEGFYTNSVVAIQIKHKFIEEPFWITLFAGAQRRNSGIQFAKAYKGYKCIKGDFLPYKLKAL